MARLLIFLVIVVLIQYLLVWALTHYGFILLGACSWWMWSLWSGRHPARQFPNVHEYGKYDLECDTEDTSSAECACRIVEALRSDLRVSAFSEIQNSATS